MSENQCKCYCKAIPFILTVIITAVVVGGGVYYWQNAKAPATTTTLTTKTDNTTLAKTTSSDNTTTEASQKTNQTYKNNYFSFEYPKNWVIEENKNNVSLFSPERKKEYDNLIKSGRPFGGQIANIYMKYTVNQSSHQKFEDILKVYDPTVTAKLISSGKINGNNVAKYNFQGYGSDIVYFAEVGDHLLEFYIAKGNDEKIMDNILKSITAISENISKTK